MPLSTVLGAQSLVQPAVCTTATRPASPYTGQAIYDTTTATQLIWNSTAWVGVGTMDVSRVNTTQQTSSISYAGLTTAQTLTLTTGTKALVILSFNSYGTVGIDTYASVAVSGATTTAASDTNSAYIQSTLSGGYGFSASNAIPLTLTAGSNTFTMQFRASTASVTSFNNRSMTVIGYS